MLRSAGHEVAVFAMRYPLNESADWEDYFPTEVSFSGSLTQKLRAVRRMLGSDDVASCFTALLNDFRPEIVHLNNIHSYLSPALASIAHALGIKVVWTLHDYKLLCPSYSRLAGRQSMRPLPLVTLQDMCTPHPLHEILGGGKHFGMD